MKEFLLGFQFGLLVVQIGCLLYSIHKNKPPLEVAGGFAIWGCIPNVLVALTSISI